MGQQQQKGGQPPAATPGGYATATASPLPAPPLQAQQAWQGPSAYTPMPKPGAPPDQQAGGGGGGTVGAPAEPPAPPAASPTPSGPTNPNAPALPEQGANVAGDVWAPGTGPSGGFNGYGGANGWGGGKSSKGGMPPGMGGAMRNTAATTQGAQGGGTPPPAGGAAAPGAFQAKFDAIRQKFGDNAAQTYAVRDAWGSGGSDAIAKMYGGSGPTGYEGLNKDAYNAAINAHGAGGDQGGIEGRQVRGPDGQMYYVGAANANRKKNKANWQDTNWLAQNAVKL